MQSVTRWIWLLLAGVLAFVYIPKILNGSSDSVQPIGPGRTETANFDIGEEPPAKCRIEGQKFSAELSTRGASLVDYFLTGDKRYPENGKPIELTTVPASAPDRFNLHFDWRALGTTGENAQVGHDVVDWTIASHDDKSCTFTYSDDHVKLTKTY